MADQEFSSPGAHMASRSSSSGSSRVIDAGMSNGSGPGESRVIYAPTNNSYANYHNSNNVHSARELSDDFSRRYMDYNNTLFNSAMEYDKYMSNTAIQRQVADLKAAGLNPVLATNLGGATYKGVNAPYISISPSSALQGYLNYDSSIYTSELTNMTNRDITKLKNDSEQFITAYNRAVDLVQQGISNEHDVDMHFLKKAADTYLENLKHLNDKDLAKFNFENQKDLDDFKYILDKRFYNYKNYGDNFGNVDYAPLSEIYTFINQVSRLIPGARGILTD